MRIKPWEMLSEITQVDRQRLSLNNSVVDGALHASIVSAEKDNKQRRTVRSSIYIFVKRLWDSKHALFIKRHCPNIKRLELQETIDGIPECIASYGKHIEEAILSFPTESALKLLSATCPNTRFSLQVRFIWQLRMVLENLGPRLKAIDYIIDGSEPQSPLDWGSCKNLESITIRGQPSIEGMRCLLEKPKSLLKQIIITDNFSFPPFTPANQKEFFSLFSRRSAKREED